MQIKKEPAAWNPQASPSFWVNHASRALMRLHDGRLRGLGFSMSQMQVLSALDEHGELSQKDLARLMRVEQPSVAELLARMERDGIITRRPNPDDKRGSLSSLTRISRARLKKAKQALIDGASQAFCDFSKKEQELVIAMMQRVVKNVEALTSDEA